MKWVVVKKKDGLFYPVDGMEDAIKAQELKEEIAGMLKSNCKDCLYHEVLAEVYDVHVDEQDCPEHGNCEEFKAMKEEMENLKKKRGGRKRIK